MVKQKRLIEAVTKKIVQYMIRYDSDPANPPICPGLIIHQPLRPRDLPSRSNQRNE